MPAGTLPASSQGEKSKLMFLSHLLVWLLSICLGETATTTTYINNTTPPLHIHPHGHGHGHGHGHHRIHQNSNFLTCFQSDNHSTSLYDFKSLDIHGAEEIPLSRYKNKVLLIVNVASF
ncbi:hypothetical protein Ahia01_001350500 [Argonauta hians]